MKIETLVVGEIDTNCYILTIDNKALIIDPGAEGNKILKFIKKNNLIPIGYLITHEHYDHTEGLDELLDEYKLKPYESDAIFSFKIINTPGHKEDSVCFYFEAEKIMFTGDTLFKGTIGRFDLPGANRSDLFTSLDKLKTFPDDVTIYPGHGPSSTIKIEKKENIWLQ